MKFKFTNRSEKCDVNLPDFLSSIYNQSNLLCFSSNVLSPAKKISPIYLNATDLVSSPQEKFNKCAAQIKRMCNYLHATLRSHTSTDIKELAPKVIVLRNNICLQITCYDDYDTKNQQNIELMCNQGKKYLEKICYNLKNMNLSDAVLLEKLYPLLTSDQISACMGGVLTILQDTCDSFENDIQSKVQLACVNAVYLHANNYIRKHKILYMYNDGVHDRSTNTAATYNEIHYINALRNALAFRFSFLGKIEDKHTALFPQHNGWLEKFVQKYDNDTFIEYFISNYLSEIVRPKYYEQNAYNRITQQLDYLGSDLDFSLYDPEQPEWPLRADEEMILRCSIIKRMINSGTVCLDTGESISEFNIEGNKYKLYTIGKPNNYWLEMLSTDGDIIYTPVKDFMQTLKHCIIFNQVTLEEGTWQKLLLAAVSCNNIKLLKCAVENTKEINCTDSLGNTPLLISIEHKNIMQIEHLLSDCRTDLNKPNHRGKSPLMLAACMNYTYVIDLLLSINSHATPTNINATNVQGYSALMLAASLGNKSSVDRLLLHPKIDVNLQSKWEGETALMLALEAHQIDIVDCIISSEKVDFSKMDNYDSNLLMLAIIHDNYKTFKYLVDNNLCDVNAKDYRDLNAMQIAIQLKREQYISVLAPKYDVESRDSDENITLLPSDISQDNNFVESKFKCSIQ